jgi:hypothetical protein
MYLELFLIPLLAALTALFIWDAMREAAKQTSEILNKESKSTTNDYKPKTKTQSLTPKERKKLLKESGIDNNTDFFIMGQPVHYGNFFGRKEIIQSLFNLWKGFPMQNAAIYGEKRIGKTSLLQYLKDVVDNPNDSRFREGQKTDWLRNSDRYCFIYVNFQDIEYQSPKRFLEYILQNMKLEKADKVNLSLSEENPLLDFGRIVKGHLINPTIVLMDEIGVILEHHPDKFENEFWDGLRTIATTKLELQCLGFVLAAHQHPTELAKKILTQGTASPFFNIFGHVTELKAFTEQEAKELTVSSPKQFSDDDVEFILKQSELKPFLLQILCKKCLEAKDVNWQPEAKKEINKIKGGLDRA